MTEVEDIGQAIFTDGERSAIADTFKESLHEALEPGERFAVDGRLFRSGLEVEISLSTPDRSSVIRLVAGHELVGEGGLDLVALRAHAVEFLHSVFSEFLGGGRWPLPHLEWKRYEFDGHAVHLRGSASNDLLESMADELLARADDVE